MTVLVSEDDRVRAARVLDAEGVLERVRHGAARRAGRGPVEIDIVQQAQQSEK